MAYNYQSNYPSYGGGGGYGGGPPPPPGGYGGAAYPGGGGYGGYAGYSSAYNVNGPYQMGSAPPPGGQYGYNQGYQSGAVPGFTVPAVQNCSGMYHGQQQVAPPPIPQSYSSQGYSQEMAQMNMQMQQMMRIQAEQTVKYERKQKRKKNRKGKKKKRQEDDEDEEDEDEEEEEEEEEEEGSNEITEAEFKKKMKEIYVGEQVRRIDVSGTLELTSGTVGRFTFYTKEDPVFLFGTKNGTFTKEAEKTEWDPETECMYLREATKGFGTNEDAIIHVVTTRSNEQRQVLKTMFKTSFGEDLIAVLSSELSFKFKTAVMALYVPPAEYDAWCIKEAIYGPGTDERALIEILLTRTNPQIQEIRRVYSKVASPNRPKQESLIEKDIEGDTSGDFKRLLYSASQGNRKHISRKEVENAVEEIEIDGNKTGMYEVNFEKLCDIDRARADAKNLFKAGEDRWGTDEDTFIRIFANRDYYQLRATYNEYVKLTQRDIENSIDRETSGDFGRGLLAIATCIKNRPKFFAKELRSAMKGLGTSDNRLIRIIVSRSEIDMVQIKKEFLEENKQTLYMWLENDCSGDYRKLLQAIVGKN